MEMEITITPASQIPNEESTRREIVTGLGIAVLEQPPTPSLLPSTPQISPPTPGLPPPYSAFESNPDLVISPVDEPSYETRNFSFKHAATMPISHTNHTHLFAQLLVEERASHGFKETERGLHLDERLREAYRRRAKALHKDGVMIPEEGEPHEGIVYVSDEEDEDEAETKPGGAYKETKGANEGNERYKAWLASVETELGLGERVEGLSIS